MARKSQNPTVPPILSPDQAIPLLKRQLERLENDIIKLPHDAPEVAAWEQRTTNLLDETFGMPNGDKHPNTFKFITVTSGTAPRLNLEVFGRGGGISDDTQVRFERKMKAKAALLKSYIEELEDKIPLSAVTEENFIGQESAQKTIGNTVFIGHGRSHLWRELKDFLSDRLALEWDEFNRESAAGVPTTERLRVMLDKAGFAFVVLTAEDEHSDGTVHARENVIHEAGMFQGKLGFQRAIILREEGCAEFSNIHGLTQILFPRNRISAIFEEVRRVLEREGFLTADQPRTSRRGL